MGIDLAMTLERPTEDGAGWIGERVQTSRCYGVQNELYALGPIGLPPRPWSEFLTKRLEYFDDWATSWMPFVEMERLVRSGTLHHCRQNDQGWYVGAPPCVCGFEEVVASIRDRYGPSADGFRLVWWQS
jgi:hypothetical protein